MSIDTIRAWERRHALVTPVRDAAGTRAYVRADIERLALARAVVELGHPIKRVATMSNEQLSHISGRQTGSNVDESLAKTVVSQVLQAISDLARLSSTLLPV